MSLTLLDRIRSIRSHELHGFVPVENRVSGRLVVREEQAHCWTVLVGDHEDAERMGAITCRMGRYTASHGYETGGYSFGSFSEALSYFTEYVAALEMGAEDR